MAYTNNKYVVAAIVGNFYQESTVNPGIWEGLTPNNPGYGLGQWTDNPPIVMRRTALFNWLDSNGYPHDSGQGQLEFLIHENVWLPNNPNFPTSAYATLTDFLNSNSTNLWDLTKEFMWHWEGIDDGSFNTRYVFAMKILDKYELGLEPGTWISGNRYLQEAESINNGLLCYRFFMGTTPPTPPEPYNPTEEEVVALVKSILRKRNKKGGIYIEL